jgi:hypothetical protein
VVLGSLRLRADATVIAINADDDGTAVLRFD